MHAILRQSQEGTLRGMFARSRASRMLREGVIRKGIQLASAVKSSLNWREAWDGMAAPLGDGAQRRSLVVCEKCNCGCRAPKRPLRVLRSGFSCNGSRLGRRRRGASLLGAARLSKLGDGALRPGPPGGCTILTVGGRGDAGRGCRCPPFGSWFCATFRGQGAGDRPIIGPCVGRLGVVPQSPTHDHGCPGVCVVRRPSSIPQKVPPSSLGVHCSVRQRRRAARVQYCGRHSCRQGDASALEGGRLRSKPR